jgi:hypothetical protein
MENLVRILTRITAVVLGVAASCAVAAGCSSSSSGSSFVASASGESCTRTADCQPGLVCVANVCGSAGADAGVAPRPSVPDGGGDAAAEASSPLPPGASGIGQACQSSRDCAAGLECIPTTGGAAVCDLASFGLTPGSKTCTGECSTAADCCELPPGVSVYGYSDGGYVYAQNCADIFSGILGGSLAPCAGLTGYSPTATACFFYQAYCNCAAATWACTGGRCRYAAPCNSQNTNDPGGCPSQTRAGRSLDSTCNLATMTCAASSCTVAADCNGLPVVDRTSTAVTCRGGDCTCVAGGCYLKCTADIDCDPGYACDTMRSVCAPAPCTSDAQCFGQLGMARARCNGGTCGIPCTVDLDCSPSGDLPGQPFNGTVCGPGGTCTPVGCSSDGDCSRSGSGPRKFCVTSPGAIRSAATN